MDRQTTLVTHLRFATLEPPSMPLKTRNGPASINLGSTTPLHNRFSPLGENGKVSGGKESEARRSRILKRGALSTSSSYRDSRGREHIPLTSEILKLLHKLETNKGR
jgi:hypothetical protein